MAHSYLGGSFSIAVALEVPEGGRLLPSAPERLPACEGVLATAGPLFSRSAGATHLCSAVWVWKTLFANVFSVFKACYYVFVKLNDATGVFLLFLFAPFLHSFFFSVLFFTLFFHPFSLCLFTVCSFRVYFLDYNYQAVVL